MVSTYLMREAIRGGLRGALGDALGGNHVQSRALRGNQERQSREAIKRGSQERPSREAIKRGYLVLARSYPSTVARGVEPRSCIGSCSTYTTLRCLGKLGSS